MLESTVDEAVTKAAGWRRLDVSVRSCARSHSPYIRYPLPQRPVSARSSRRTNARNSPEANGAGSDAASIFSQEILDLHVTTPVPVSRPRLFLWKSRSRGTRPQDCSTNTGNGTWKERVTCSTPGLLLTAGNNNFNEGYHSSTSNKTSPLGTKPTTPTSLSTPLLVPQPQAKSVTSYSASRRACLRWLSKATQPHMRRFSCLTDITPASFRCPPVPTPLFLLLPVASVPKANSSVQYHPFKPPADDRVTQSYESI